ncbi:MAG: putative lipid II flippase FtsW [Oscillospiraceae bacterium]|nr:putative lipid II flippase FtsW [Oscillospiraceae bacterium]
MKRQMTPKKKKIDSTFSGLVLVLLAIGLISLCSASYVVSYYQFENSWHFIIRQLIFAIIGVVAMFVVGNIDYKILFKYAELFYGFAVVLLGLVLFMHPINGARRWLALGPVTFQPSEVAKLAIIIIFAKYITINEKRMNTFKFGVTKLIGFMLVVAGLMLLEPHISGTVLIFIIGTIMMFVGGTNLFWFAVGGAFIVFVVLFVIFTPGIANYAASRVSYWLDPFADPQGKGYQTIQSLYAIGAGGIFGVGVGNSKQKQLYLPEAQNDFVFSVVCEEVGLIGAVAIILVFAALFYRGIRIAQRTHDKFGFMIVVGIMVQLATQTLLNIAVVTNTVPNTGISMPFFSYGGTLLMMLLAEMGFVLSVSKFGGTERRYLV